MCVLLQSQPCNLPPGPLTAPHGPQPRPLLFRGPSLTPLGFSSHGNPWRPHPSGLLIPEAPGVWARWSSPSPYHGVVCCWLLLLPSASEAPFSLPRSPQASPGAPKPPGPAASPDPLAIPKYGVAAERPVEVQVYLRDVPGGDQGLLLHFLWENRGGGAGISDTDPDLSRAAILGREPCGHHGSGSAKTSCLALGGWGWRECPPCPWDLCEGLCPAVVGGEVTEGQPGWEGTGGQSRWEGDMGVLCTRWRIRETTKEPT